MKGRPTLPEEEKRNRIYKIRLTNKEYEILKKISKKENKPISVFIREFIHKKSTMEDI